MTVHIRGIGPQLWKLIVNGYKLAEGTTDTALIDVQIKENDRLYVLDSKAMSILYCGLNRTEYNRFSSCATGKEIWTRLEANP